MSTFTRTSTFTVTPTVTTLTPTATTPTATAPTATAPTITLPTTTDPTLTITVPPTLSSTSSPITTSSPIITSRPITTSSPTTTQSSTIPISSIIITSVVSSSSLPPTSTSEPSESNAGSSPVLVTTISVVVGAILLALLAAWIIHTLIKSRREKKENERLAVDEDLGGMFNSPMMVNNNRTSLYDQNDVFWDPKTGDNRTSIVQDYPRQNPDMESQMISSAPDSEDHGIPESRLYQSDFHAVEGAAIAGAAIAGAQLARQGTMGSNSTSPLIQNGKGGNFVRVISDYTAVRPDELNMRQGQILMLEQTFQDGWAYGKNVTTQERGMFPFNFVAPVESSNFQQS